MKQSIPPQLYSKTLNIVAFLSWHSVLSLECLLYS